TSGLAVARGPCRLSGRNVMSEPRFTTLTPETMTADQKRVADAIQSGPRGAGLRGPFNALLRSPELCDLVQRVGAFVRFGSSIPPRLNEMAIIMAGRKWTAQYEFYAHRRLALEAGLSPAIADAIAANQRPAGMAKDEESVYDFVSQLLATGSVSDAAFQRVKDAFAERGVVDLVGAVGYCSLVAMAQRSWHRERRRQIRARRRFSTGWPDAPSSCAKAIATSPVRAPCRRCRRRWPAPNGCNDPAGRLRPR